MPVPNKSNIPIGTVIDGKFRITKEIGRGGMAAVYEAENIDIGKRVAVKVLSAELITSRVVRERFIREARAAAAIRSPYICDVYDSGTFDERPYLVMELLEGESLYDMMTRVRRMDLTMTLTIATHVARGLQKAHDSNVVHRDLKPENIFITQQEDGALLCKILDFGLAKFYEPAEEAQNVRLTREGALFGTPAYMSPEQAKGQGAVDHRADLWALGCIVYECFTGQTVWNVEQGVAMILAQIAGAPIPRPSRLRPDLPPSFDQWFQRALDRDPNNRYQTAKEFAESLMAALSPGRPRVMTSSVPSDVESRAVDDLIASPNPGLAASGLGASSLSPVARGPRTGTNEVPGAMPGFGPTPDNSALQPLDVAASSAPAAKGGSAGAIAWLLLAATVALGSYAIWLYVIHPPGDSGKTTDSAVESAKKADELKPLETSPHALQIAAAQEWLRKGERKKALTMFKESYQNGGKNVSRSLLSHAEVALEGTPGNCRVTGLSRPRPFDISAPISRPSVAVTPSGIVYVWVDSHHDKRRRQAFAVLLDHSLRRVSPPHLITPEAASVRHPQLLTAGDKIAFIYFDGAGKQPGVYTRLLMSDGRISSPPRRVSASKRDEFFPALTRTSDGNYWAVWEEDVDRGATDLVARQLDQELQPISPPLRLTAFGKQERIKIEAGKPDVSVAHGKLNISFALERGPKNHQIMLLRVPLDSPDLEHGLGKNPKLPPASKNQKLPADRVIGELIPVSAAHGRNSQPRIACNEPGCFVAWDDDDAGALAAFIAKDKQEKLWHREFARKGSRPTLARDSAGQVRMAWFGEGRVNMASITRDGVSKANVLSRVSGYQPYPALVEGKDSREWYLAWRDFEAGHYEGFLIRADCAPGNRRP